MLGAGIKSDAPLQGGAGGRRLQQGGCVRCLQQSSSSFLPGLFVQV